MKLSVVLLFLLAVLGILAFQAADLIADQGPNTPGGNALPPAPSPAAKASGGTEGPPGAAKAAPPVPAPAKRPAVVGHVRFKGERPKPVAVEMKDAVCQKEHPTPPVDEAQVVSEDGAIPNVLVYVKKGLEGEKFEPPKEAKTLDQKGCVFVPRVVSLQVGQALKIENSDATNHNVNAVAVVCTPWPNQSIQKGQSLNWVPDVEEFEPPIKVKCDIHGWMRAYIAVLPHPFHAVTGGDGRFVLEGLPPGKYTIAAWHESFGTATAEVELGEKDEKQVDLTMEPSTEPPAP